MVKSIWAEGMQEIERTKILEEELTKYGYKMQTQEFFKLLEEFVRLKEDNWKLMRSKKVMGFPRYVCSEATETVGYYTMKLDNGIQGFYITYLKLKPEGAPEVRLVIENEKEFVIFLEKYLRALFEWSESNRRVTIGGK